MPHYEYDKDYPFAAFITNLGKYNEGDLVGEWVKFPTTPEEMQKVLNGSALQKDDFGQPYEEWFITDYDCYVDGLYDKLGEYENLGRAQLPGLQLDEMSQGDTNSSRRRWRSATIRAACRRSSTDREPGLLRHLPRHPRPRRPGPVLHRGAGRHAGAGTSAELHRL